MLIYDALKKDHEEVKSLLNQLISLADDDSAGRKVLLGQIRDALIPHSRAEESVFYNSLRMIDSAKSLVMHSYKDHLEAETLLRTLQLKDKIDADWKATALDLQRALNDHILQEETDVFTAAQALFTPQEATMMAEAFEELKPRVKEEGFVGTTLDMIGNLMPPRFSSVFKKSDTSPRV